MNPVKQSLLNLFCGGMEITWRYAWVFFLTLLTLNRPFPLLVSMSAFAMGYFVTVLAGYKDWRFYQSLLFHIVGFTFIWILTVYLYFYRHMFLFELAWVAEWFKQLQAPKPLLIQLLVFACLLLFWLGARAMVKRRQTYYIVCLQFDKGLLILFLLFLIKWAVQVKGGILLVDPVTRYLLFAFFTFSLLAINLSRTQSNVQKTFRPGYHSIGILLGFAATVLLGSIVLSVVFLPYLTLMADSAQSVLKETAEPMGPVIVSIIRFLFSIGKYRRNIESPISGGLNNDPLYPDSEIGWAHGFGWVLLGATGLVGLWVSFYLIRWLVRRLMKRNSMDKSKPSSLVLIYRLLAIIGAICRGVWNRLLLVFKRIDSSAAVFTGMLNWGRRSGLPVALSETPIEYGNRLSHHFPQFKEEIEMIIGAFNLELYGDITTNERLLSQIVSAQRKMQSPRHWLSRLRGWFVQQPLQHHSSRLEP